MEYSVALPSKPRIVEEKESSGVYEIDGLYTGYGHTLGNSLRRIILSSLTGAAITSVKIDGVSHEFATIDGIQEDVITILLNLKRLRIALDSDDAQHITLDVTGPGKITARDIKAPTQVRILTPDQHIAEITQKGVKLSIEMTVEKGLGYVPREVLQAEKVDVGTIALDATFTPIRRVNYEVENMRVGDRTDFNRLRMFIETDGTLTPREALEKAIGIMIHQLKAIVGFKEEEVTQKVVPQDDEQSGDSPEAKEAPQTDADVLKTRIESLDISSRTINVLSNANIRTVGGLTRKKESDVLEIEGMGEKGLVEIKEALTALGVTLKAE